MPALDLFLPMPPTTNNLYQTVVNPKTHRVMRQKSKAYEAWIERAGRAPLAGSWRRLVEDGEDTPPWALLLVVYGLPKNADLSNRLKAVEDLICMMTGLADCNTMQIDMRKKPKHEDLGACVRVWVATLTAEEVG